MSLFWWNGAVNLGDALSPVILKDAEWAPPEQATWVGIGSVLEWFDGREVTIFGTGRASPRAPKTDLSRANVLALRGQHTQGLVSGPRSPVLGDPGLLAVDIITPAPDGYDAVVPHWSDRDRLRAMYPKAVFADVTRPQEALEIIAGAERVIASALHGLVLADAFGIPRRWEWFDNVQGKGFKFHDYGTVVGWAEPGEWYLANTALVERVQSELRDALSQ